jgi:amylosucrase
MQYTEEAWMTERERLLATRSLERIWPRIQHDFAPFHDEHPDAWHAFECRLRREWPRLFGLLYELYGQQYDFFYHIEQLIGAMARSWMARPAWLRQLDGEREADPAWFQSQRMLGGVLYVDLFAGSLAGVRAHIPYLKELGLTYLHLMPLFDAPRGDNDGGYAVSSYRDVNPALGTMDELCELASELHKNGISLVVDFVFNHTSDEHMWARRAQAGDPDFLEFYFTFPDRSLPDEYQRTLREIFPTVRRGNFTYCADMKRWVWTTFNSFQWDLNYHNPDVFRAMADEMLFLANNGIDILRLDAVAFIWKHMGTSSENLPEAHTIIQAFNAVARIAAPSLLFKSEAIVHPDDVVKYIGVDECQISYNPLLMALLWETLATREVKLLAHSMHTRFRLPPGTAWVNYLRSHDDIGWTFDDEDAWRLGIEPFGHRRFLNDFYVGRFPGSFARGVPFQENPDTGDARVSGTLASMAGLEQAVQADDPKLIELAIRRIILLHSIILSIGGIPLIYIGDEIGMLNDYSYATNRAKSADSRWVHRPAMDWARAEHRHDLTTPEGQIFNRLQQLIALRKEQDAFWDGDVEVVDSGNPHVFSYVRAHAGKRVLVAANMSERAQRIDGNRLRVHGPGYQFVDIVSGQAYTADAPLMLEPYTFVWLAPQQ